MEDACWAMPEGRGPTVTSTFGASDGRPSTRDARPVDALLRAVSAWRRSLTADIAHRTPSLTALEVDAAVRPLIERVVFSRLAEARGLAALDELKACADDPSAGVGKRLTDLLARAGERYGSRPFPRSQTHGGRSADDSARTPPIVGDTALRRIVADLYDPDLCEYSALPDDILGRVYEQLLSETVVLGDGSARVVPTPMARKSGGVVYTPAPIVDYIVEETLGSLLNGCAPAEAARLRIVDPACGSGAFLIAAYQYLLDWHTAQHAAGLSADSGLLETNSSGGVTLATAERTRILLSSIHGVDIDPGAVEVTKLSLLLKALEGASAHDPEVARVVSGLDDNIRCGNSLIDVDYALSVECADDERRSVNPFSWHAAFPTVFGAGGFDAVVGNPPYLSVDSVWGRRDPRQAYLKAHYPEVYADRTDLLFYFLAKSVEICRGEIAMIVSRSFLEAHKAQRLRGWLSTNARVREVVDFREAAAFPRAGINTAIVRLTRSRAVHSAAFRRYRGKALPPGYAADHLRDVSAFEVITKRLDELGSGAWVATGPADTALIAKIDAAGPPVGEVLLVGQGMQTGDNAAFAVADDATELLEAARDHELVEHRARNSDIEAYRIAPDGPAVLYLEDAASLESLPGAVRDHLERHRPRLEGRAAYRRGDCDWWRYTWPLHQNARREPRILAP
jgi:N-6 DNA Methylase